MILAFKPYKRCDTWNWPCDKIRHNEFAFHVEFHQCWYPKKQSRTPIWLAPCCTCLLLLERVSWLAFHCVQSQKKDRIHLVMRGISVKMMFALLVKVHDEEHCHRIISLGYIHLTLMCNIHDRYDGLSLFDHNGQTKDQGQYPSYVVCKVCRLTFLLHKI